jgi:RNA polymerase sigma-70 factor (ECF subfamily)
MRGAPVEVRIVVGALRRRLLMDRSAQTTTFDVTHELVARVRLGDDAAFEQLVRTAFPPLWRFAVGLTGSGETAKDIVQDVLCRVWQLGADWRPAGSARSYLYASVRNKAIDLRNRIALEEQFHERAMRDAAANGAVVPAPDAKFDGDDRAAAMWREVAALSERQRSALRLRFEEQLTVVEVARVLGMTPKVAENILCRAIQQLRKRLGVGPAASLESGGPSAIVADPADEALDRADTGKSVPRTA